MKAVKSSLNLDLDLSLPDSLLDSLFEHPAWCTPVIPDVQTSEILVCPQSFSTAY